MEEAWNSVIDYLFFPWNHKYSVEWLDKINLFTQAAAARRRERKNEDKRVQTQVSDWETRPGECTFVIIVHIDNIQYVQQPIWLYDQFLSKYQH